MSKESKNLNKPSGNCWHAERILEKQKYRSLTIRIQFILEHKQLKAQQNIGGIGTIMYVLKKGKT